MRKIDKEILGLAVPSIITNITTPLLALMDVVIVGHLGSAAYIAAISVGGTMFNVVYWLFAFLRMGTSGLSAQAHGANDREGENIVLGRGVFVSMVASITLIILSPVILRFGFAIMEIQGEVAQMASLYFRILIFGVPAVFLTYTFSGWFLGLKNPQSPMWVSLIINVTNIIVSLVLVFGLGWKIEGVAAGTLTAQWIGAIACITIALRRHGVYLPSFHSIVEWQGVKRFFRINTDIFLRTLCLIAVTVWFTRTGSSQGTVTLAVNTLLMQFFVLFSYFMDGFAFAGESLSGNLKGAGDHAGLKECIAALFRWGAAMAFLFTIIYFLTGSEIMRLLSDDTQVREASHEFFAWVLLLPLAGFAAFTWDGICIGLTATRFMLGSMAAATAVYFAVWFLLFPKMGNHGLWLAFVSYLFVRGLFLTIYSNRL